MERVVKTIVDLIMGFDDVDCVANCVREVFDRNDQTQHLISRPRNQKFKIQKWRKDDVFNNFENVNSTFVVVISSRGKQHVNDEN